MNKKCFKATDYNAPFIEQRADPFVCRGPDGMYYFTASVPEYDRIVLRRAATIDGLRRAEEITNSLSGISLWTQRCFATGEKNM